MAGRLAVESELDHFLSAAGRAEVAGRVEDVAATAVLVLAGTAFGPVRLKTTTPRGGRLTLILFGRPWQGVSSL